MSIALAGDSADPRFQLALTADRGEPLKKTAGMGVNGATMKY